MPLSSIRLELFSINLAFHLEYCKGANMHFFRRTNRKYLEHLQSKYGMEAHEIQHQVTIFVSFLLKFHVKVRGTQRIRNLDYNKSKLIPIFKSECNSLKKVLLHLLTFTCTL